MNVNDFDAKEAKGDMLEEIFTMQKALHEKYLPVEYENGTGFSMVRGRDFDINDKHWQAMCKEMSYRVVEELTESYEAFQFHLENSDVRKHKTHVVEELIDALHFLTEYLIVIGLKAEDLVRSGDTDKLFILWDRRSCSNGSGFSWLYMQIVFQIGTATNLLKLRPWKKTHMVTDEARFHGWLTKSFRSLIILLRDQGLTATDIYELYTKKNSVNSWRIGSGY